MEILVGCLIGVVIAATGLGAGIPTTPLSILLLGLPPVECVGTVLVFSAAIKVLATFLYARRGHVDRRVLGYLLAGGIPGAIAGALPLDRMRSARPTAVVLALVGSTVILSAVSTLLRPTAREGNQERLRLGSWLAPIWRSAWRCPRLEERCIWRRATVSRRRWRSCCWAVWRESRWASAWQIEWRPRGSDWRCCCAPPYWAHGSRSGGWLN